MPLFEFHCADCGSSFERLVWSSAAESAAVCDCGSVATERIPYSRVAIGAGRAEAAEPCGNPGGCCGGACRTH